MPRPPILFCSYPTTLMLPHAQVLLLLLLLLLLLPPPPLLLLLLFRLASNSLPPLQSKLIAEHIGPLLHLNQTSRYAALYLPVLFWCIAAAAACSSVTRQLHQCPHMGLRPQL